MSNELLQPVTFYTEEEERQKDALKNFNPMGELMKMDSKELSVPTEYTQEKKPARKKAVKAVDPNDLNKEPAKTPLNSDKTYFSTYDIPRNVLTQTAVQIEELVQTVRKDLEDVRHARTLKGKYDYISNMTSTLGSLYSNKISIAREMANTITNAHRLELSKHKELAIDSNADSDEKRVMDSFNAFMNAPMGAIPQAMRNIHPATINTPEMGVPVYNDPTTGMVTADGDSGFDAYVQNMTPEQNAMLNSSNPFVETVVVYDQSNQNKWFEVIDTRTGQQVPNMPIPADFILGGCVVDIRNGIARNASINKTYKLKLVGSRAADEF